MSQRNSLAAKTAARERLRAEREKQAKRDKLRRQLLVFGGVIATLAVLAGVAVAVVKMNQPSYWEAAKDKKLVKPAHSSGTNGTSILVGSASAKHTLKVYEDLRCPYCAQFEQTSGDTMAADVKAGTYNMSYTMGAFLDDSLGQGQGSKNALSALGAALNVSTDAFVAYHKVLYSKAVHPEETTDAFGSDTNLIKYAQKVPALKDNAAFQKAVKDGTYDKWALTMAAQFDSDGITGTPTVKLDGTAIENPQSMTADQFEAAIKAQLAK
ncbi:thioredoxin domain-containing protein [Streptomyces sp. NBC_01262]|jgi:protein-disulfide isomerase|uniref:thioredoxin domain-containing protein n=1 Tax=Streptomyces sp. NBC_01262 TaxID=2903803 RepID=UPI002E2F1AAB|nr:thioredoxin domain-containing protein [Streptomyces sp. NBC_01262]